MWIHEKREEEENDDDERFLLESDIKHMHIHTRQTYQSEREREETFVCFVK